MDALLWIIVTLLAGACAAFAIWGCLWRHESNGWESLAGRLLDGKRFGRIARAAVALEGALFEFGPDPAALGESYQRLEDALAAEIPGLHEPSSVEPAAAAPDPRDQTKPTTIKRWPL